MNFHTTSVKAKSLGLLGAFLAWLADAAYILLQKAADAESSVLDAEFDAKVADLDAAIRKGEEIEAALNSTIDKLSADQGEAQAEIAWLKFQRDALIY